MGLTEDLGAGPVGLDTAVFIYFVEDHPVYAPLLAEVFDKVSTGRVEAITSAVTLLEVLVVPYRCNDNATAQAYESLLTRSRGLTIRDLDRDLLRNAARIRAGTGIKTPDALQLAAAHAGGCSAFLTNDRRLPPVGGMKVLQLREYVEA